MKGSELRLIPLGGVGEIGMNAYLYELGDELMLVDLGITFADDRLPGADIILPDMRYLEERVSQLKGLVLTHAHEDHIGAVSHWWPRLKCPIWCSPFTAAVLRRKLADAGIERSVQIKIIQPLQSFEVGSFGCRFIHVSHSVLDACALVIETPLGKVLHTGDWKLDPAPMLGERTDGASLEELGNGGVLAMVGDSTNVLSPGSSGSEAEVRESLTGLIAQQPNRVVLTTFASNVVRLESAIHAARASGREAFVIGRSMRRMIDAAREVGYLKDLPVLGDDRDAMDVPRNRAFFLCTGSQGEQRSAMQKIAANAHPRIHLEAGDSVIFSSKIIPGNERSLFNLHNQLVADNIEVITEEDHFVHVSGHPCRDEMEQMYRWVRPKIAVPVHGEARHLSAHVRFAKKLGVEQSVLIGNGDVLRLAPGQAEVVGTVPFGRLVVDSDDFVDAGDDLFRARRRLAGNGSVMVSVVLDDAGSVLATPKLTVLGVVDPARAERSRDGLLVAITDAVEALDDETVMDDERLEEVVRATVRQGLDLPRHRRPVVDVQITRLGPDVLNQADPEERAHTR